MSKKKKKDLYEDENTVLANEVTGMIPALPQSEIDALEYSDIYPVHRQKLDEEGK